ncbi:MAG: hypothetical protein HYT28_00420 [Parcubacteria group bacterium]|nr:hypothetical protein [Parcubacteria group bacterium]
MKNIFLTTWFGIKTPFKDKNYIVLFLLAFVVMFILFILIPVFTVAGNTVATQLEIFTLRDYLVVGLLSGLYSLFMTMQIYVMRQKKKIDGLGTTVSGGVGALFAGIAGTAFCTSCLAPLFSFFGIGFGGVVFALNYRLYFVVVIILALLIAIYLTARKISKVCTLC